MGVFKAAVQEPLFKNSIAIFLNTASAGVFGLLFWIVAARNFPLIEVGLASAAISVIQLISNLAMVGTDNALIRFLSQIENKKGVFTALFALIAASSILLSLFALFSLNFFAPALAFLQGGLFAFAFVACVMITAISPYLNVALIALRRSDMALVTTLAGGSRVIILIILSSIGMLGILASFLAGYVLSCILGLFILYHLGITFIRQIPSLPYKDIIHFGLGTYIAGIFISAPIGLVPLMIIQTIGAEQNAYFFIAYNIAAITLVASSAVAMSLFVEGSHGMPLRPTVIKASKLVLIIAIPLLAFIFLFGENLVALLFGVEYATHAIVVLKLLSLANVVGAVSSIYFAIKRIQKDVGVIILISLINLVLLIGLGYPLLLLDQLTGIGYAWLLANIITSAIIVIISILRDKWMKRSLILLPRFFNSTRG